MIHLTLSSSNKKTGPIPVSTSSAATCPDACPFKKQGCYADSGPLALHWRKVTEQKRGLEFAEFLKAIKNLPKNQIWRHNQAGDLAGINAEIDQDSLIALVKANQGKKGFTYTHKPMNARNAELVRYANERGFTINLSANNLNHADELKSLNVGPVCVVVPSDAPQKGITPNGNRWVSCPAENGSTSCAKCGLCQKQRGVIIAFHAHGTGKGKVNKVVQ